MEDFENVFVLVLKKLESHCRAFILLVGRILSSTLLRWRACRASCPNSPALVSTSWERLLLQLLGGVGLGLLDPWPQVTWVDPCFVFAVRVCWLLP